MVLARHRSVVCFPPGLPVSPYRVCLLVLGRAEPVIHPPDKTALLRRDSSYVDGAFTGCSLHRIGQTPPTPIRIVRKRIPHIALQDVYGFGLIIFIGSLHFVYIFYPADMACGGSVVIFLFGKETHVPAPVVYYKHTVEHQFQLFQKVSHTPAGQHLAPFHRTYRMADKQVFVGSAGQQVVGQFVSKCFEQAVDINTQVRLRDETVKVGRYGPQRAYIPRGQIRRSCREIDPWIKNLFSVAVVHHGQAIVYIRITLLDMFNRCLLGNGRCHRHAGKRRNLQVVADDIVQFRVSAGYLYAHALICPSCDDFGAVTVHPVIGYQNGSSFACHFCYRVQAVQVLIKCRVGRVAERQGDVVGIFAVFGEKRILTLHLHAEVFWQYGGNAVDV